jgi:homoserine dehydrogenase
LRDIFAPFTMRKINIGLAGLGTIGTGVYKNLLKNRVLLTERLGLELAVTKVAERDWPKARTDLVPEEQRTTRWEDLIEDPSINVIIELIGGTGIALRLILRALEAGKAVVTANKALLSKHGKQIFETAEKNKTPVFFEAAVAGGIPIIKTVTEAFVANHILSIHGIVNGTCNYILTRMTDLGQSFEDALREAQQAGYAEADPTLDINGGDSGHKAAILASLAYGFWVPEEKIFVEGIEKITAEDIRFAKELGYRIKLLAIIKGDKNGEIEARVHPTLIPQSHVLASVSGVFNAVAVHGDVVGETLFYGRGAGADATSSAVISDIAEAGLALESPRHSTGFTPHGLYGTCKPIGEIVSQYYLRLSVEDKPGVLAQVAGILGENGIGISSVIQPESHEGEAASLVLMIHDASNAQMQTALTKIEKLDCVKNTPRMMRVETFS